jgi:hypothetical protein
MKCGAYKLVGSAMVRLSASLALSLPLVGSVGAGVPRADHTLAAGNQERQPRLLGKKAVMHVYYYAPNTLEITSVTSRFFKDVDACERAVGGTLRVATPHASQGDLVDVQCVAIDPPETIVRPEEKHPPTEVTEL